jgi:hypothetical protein
MIRIEVAVSMRGEVVCKKKRGERKNEGGDEKRDEGGRSGRGCGRGCGRAVEGRWVAD